MKPIEQRSNIQLEYAQRNLSLKRDNQLKQRRPFQKVLMAIAFISYFSAILCGGAAFYFGEGSQDPIAASLMASVVFFVGVGIVLQVIGSSNLPNLKFEK